MNRTVYPLTLFYDAACPVCALEMDHLRERDRSHRLRFIDISAAGFDASPWGVSARALDAEIHGLCADGTMLRGVEVLRLAYAAAGLGWVLRPTGWAPLKPLFDLGYGVFARHRRKISRAAAPLVAHLRARRARQRAERMRRCSGAACDRSAS
ncbi:hypothetical protein GPROT2_03509 [Gammaproteobacteria bacterium]|nr:hypothetical protein GPROT2_03509 [Gammaproteobacteria bacterium]